MQAHREMNELGENGYLLMQNTLPSEPDMDSVNSNTILRHTQSCQFPMKKTQTRMKIVERRKSVWVINQIPKYNMLYLVISLYIKL